MTDIDLRRELIEQRVDARRRMIRGLVMLALVPVIAAAGIILGLSLTPTYGFMLILASLGYTIAGGLGGAARLIGGMIDHRDSSRELRELDEARQLPAARVVREG